ncbi:MAG TPA: SLC13 family permease [Arachnia sp.]|nr:SLC13 family permease [Arachnia sp.]HMT86741.1 SLC13 family permease [Arachnia sp.]
MSQAAIVLVVLACAIAAFVSNRIPPGIVALGTSAALFLTGVLTYQQTVAGFGDPVVMFIASLFVVSAALDLAGLTTWVGNLLIARVGTRPQAILTGVVLVTAPLTALITVNGAAAALIPVAVVLALRSSQAPSRILMAMAFAAHAGSLLTLMGSPVNLLVSDLAEESGARAFNFFEFALVGVPLVLGTLVIVVLLAPRVLPDRVPLSAPKDLSTHAETLSRHYKVDRKHLAMDREHGLTEVLITPRSPHIGWEAFPGMRTESGDLVVVALVRGGENIKDRTTLRPGDVLLLRGPWDALKRGTGDSAGVLPVDDPRDVQAQAVGPNGGAIKAGAVLAVMVALLVSGVAPPALIAMGAAMAMVLLKAVTVKEAHRSLELTTLIVIGGMIPLSTAIQVSGASDMVADGLLSVFGDSSPRWVLLGLVLVVLVLGQVISNMATVLIVAPIALAVAESGGYSPLPFLMAMAVAGAAAFFTPIATPANTMIMAPGGYRFGDYWKLGLPLAALFVVVSVALVPVIWPF